MILDAIGSLSNYQAMANDMEMILAWMKDKNLTSLEVGRYEIPNCDSFVLIQEYDTKDEDVARWESHINYMDIQVVLSGIEYMGYTNIDGLTIKEPYNPDKDIMFFEKPEYHFDLQIKEGHFAMFFPNDAHKPGFDKGNKTKVKKAVIKVRL